MTEARQRSIPRIVNARTPEEWAERIREKWQDNVAGIFEVGLELSNAREELGSAEFFHLKDMVALESGIDVTRIDCLAVDHCCADDQPDRHRKLHHHKGRANPPRTRGFRRGPIGLEHLGRLEAR